LQLITTVIGKGGKVRQLHLHAELLQILSEYITVRPIFYQHAQSPALFISKKGNRLAIRTMEDNLRNIVQRVDFTKPVNITCHTRAQTHFVAD